MTENFDMKRFEKILTTLRITVRFQHDAEEIDYIYQKEGRLTKRIILIRADWKDHWGANQERFKRKFVRDVLHDIGHFLVAPPQRRKRKDFGIPNDETKSRTTKWLTEEYKAQIIQRDLERYVGVSSSEPESLKKEKSKVRDGKDNYYSLRGWYEKEGKVIAKTVIDLAESI